MATSLGVNSPMVERKPLSNGVVVLVSDGAPVEGVVVVPLDDGVTDGNACDFVPLGYTNVTVNCFADVCSFGRSVGK